MKTEEERAVEVEELRARAQDPTDEYDGHHGTDRSEDSLAYAKENDPTTYARVTAKMGL